jgi:hypothetical protein
VDLTTVLVLFIVTSILAAIIYTLKRSLGNTRVEDPPVDTGPDIYVRPRYKPAPTMKRDDDESISTGC